LHSKRDGWSLTDDERVIREDVWWVDGAAGWLGVGMRDDEVECVAISVGGLHNGLM